MKPVRLSRRQVLRGGAGAAISLPLLEATDLLGRSAYAQGPRPRFIVFSTVLGNYPERFWPRPPGAPAFAPDYRPAGHYNTGLVPDCPALDTTDFELSAITAPLAPWKDRLLFVEGLDFANWGHGGFQTRLTGLSGTGVSLDQMIARKVAGDTRFPSLQFGVAAGGVSKFSCISWYDVDKGLAPEGDPGKMFARVFGDSVGDPAALERLRQRRKSVLDTATGHVSALQATLGAADRAKLQNYLDSLREVEKRLLRVDALTCAKPASSAPTTKGDAGLPDVAAAQVDLLAAAFACDLTRVATLQIGIEGTTMTHPWLGVSKRFHDLSHTNLNAPDTIAGFDQITSICQWHAQTLARLCQKLQSIPEGTGTALDNTLILWFNGLTLGTDHTNDNVPFLLIGNVNRSFKTGRHVRVRRSKSYASNQMANDLYLQIARAFGIPMQTFGTPAWNRGSLDLLRA